MPRAAPAVAAGAFSRRAGIFADCCQPRCQVAVWLFGWLEAFGLSACFSLAPRAGFEPATNRLTAGCSTTELPGNGAEAAWAEPYNKRAGLWPAAIPPVVVSTRVVRVR